MERPEANQVRPSVSSRQAQRSMKDAFEALQKIVTEEEKREFNSTTLENVFQTARDIERELAARGELRNMRRIQPLFDWLLRYSKEMEILCNGTPYLPYIWAPIRLMLHMASDFTSAIEKLIQAYGQIASCLPRLDRLSVAFKDNSDFQQVLAAVYVDILLFHERAYKFFRRKGWRLFFNSSWSRFDAHFQTILDSITRHADLVDKEAIAYHIAEVKEWRQTAMEKALRKEKEASDFQRQAVMSWLKASDFSQEDELGEQNDKSHDGTCDWITKNKSVRAWIHAKRGHDVLWLKGKPGSGKTVLCANLVRFLQLGPSTTILYYFCNNYRSKHANSVPAVLRSLCAQFIAAEPVLSSHVYDAYVCTDRLPSGQNLSQILISFLPSFENVRIIIDGVDEWEHQPIKKLLNELFSLFLRNNGSSKLLVSSRDLPHLSRILSRKPTLSLSDEKEHVDCAIRKFANAGISEIFATFVDESHSVVNSTLSDAIEAEIVERADGMFLWVRLILATLERADSVREMKEAVRSFPRELADVYKRILRDMTSRLTTTEVAKVHRVFHWILFAKRPLRAFELQYGVALHEGNTNLDHESKPLRKTYDICRPLVEEGSHQTVVFVHSSVKEYLLDAISGPEIDAISAQKDILFACTLYITISYDLISPSSTRSNCIVEIGEGMHSLQHYSNAFWHEHLLEYAALVPSYAQDRTSPLALQLMLLCEKHDRACKLTKPTSTSSLCKLGNGGMEECLRPLDDWLALQNIVRQTLKKGLQSVDKSQIASGISVAAEEQGDVSVHRRILVEYNDIVHLLLCSDSVEGLSAGTLHNFKEKFGPSAFICNVSSCSRSSVGFQSKAELDRHLVVHGPRFRCESSSCDYSTIGFRTRRALIDHNQKYHAVEAETFVPEIFRRPPIPQPATVSTQELQMKLEPLSSGRITPSNLRQFLQSSFQRQASLKKDSWQHRLSASERANQVAELVTSIRLAKQPIPFPDAVRESMGLEQTEYDASFDKAQYLDAMQSILKSFRDQLAAQQQRMMQMAQQGNTGQPSQDISISPA